MTVIFTARLSYSGSDRLNITRLGRDPVGIVFAPSESILWPFKALKRSRRATRDKWLEYKQAYLAEMRDSQMLWPNIWRQVFWMNPSVTLCCYCENPGACHRVVLAKLVATAVEHSYEGER